MKKTFALMVVVLIILINSYHPIDNEIIENINQFPENDKYKIFYEGRNEIIYENCEYPMFFSELGLNESNEHGGGWLDTFKKEDGIDGNFSDHILVQELNATLYMKPEIDNFTIANWDFDEGTGLTAFDSSPNNNHGALQNGVTWTSAGKYKSALNYHGGNDYVETPMHLGAGNTIEGWIKLNSTLDMDIWGDEGGWRGCGFQVSSGYFYTLCSVYPNPHRFSIGVIPKVNVWYYIVQVYGTSNTKTYVNGTLKSNSSYVLTKQTNSLISFKFGRSSHGGYHEGFFNGTIDEVIVHNRALTALEIKDRYENGSRKNTPYGNLTSNEIKLPKDMEWDSILIKKTQPADTYLNITIYNSSDNKPISGSPTYISDGEFDISYINPVENTSIKLNATFRSDSKCAPALHYWGVSWNKTNSWKDTLFGGLKYESSMNVNCIVGEARFKNTGTLRTKTISIPTNFYYDKLIVNKTEPIGGSLSVSVLNSQTNTVISGFNDLTGSEIDISGIDPKIYPGIKLKATYTTTGQDGILHDWSINWTKNNKPMITDVKSVQILNRTFITKISINLSDPDEPEEDLNLTVKYKSPVDVTWETEYLSTPIYANNRWEVPFTPKATAELGEYTFQIICEDFFQYQDIYQDPFKIEVININPDILNITTSSLTINRTKILDIYIDPFDIEIPLNSLIMTISYKAPSDSEWQIDFISNVVYQNSRWECKFTPSKTAELGLYSLNITCNDSVSEAYGYTQIEVINNKPEQPTVVLIPNEPKTIDDLDVLVSKGKDVETPTNQIEFWYRWYLDDIYMPGYDNYTQILSNLTTKHETWYCEVFAFDGDDLGNPGSIETTIENSAPELIEVFDNYEINEDQRVILKNKLVNIFNDPDGDVLSFSAIGQKYSNIQIFQDNGTIIFTPVKNWYGVEYITFYVEDDDYASANETLLLTINPSNDLPRITQIGSQLITGEPSKLEFVVKQNHWLNLTIGVSDIDGDVQHGMINYIMNITERANLYFKKNENELVFCPTNADVGMHYFTVRITDNNETPPIYISQDIAIQVLNVNDPPTVSILQPINNKKFVDAKQIILDCEADDIDFYVPNANEELSYKWESNITSHHILSFDKRIVLTNDTLPKPGTYYIRLTVTDKTGLNASETINIVVQETPRERETGASTFDEYFMISMIIIIIIVFVIMAVLIFVMTQRKKRKREVAIDLVAPPQEVIQPVESYRPEPEPTAIGAPVTPSGGTIAASGTADRLAGDTVAPVIVSISPTQAVAIEPTPAPQLPPTQPEAQQQAQTSTEVEKDNDELAAQEKIKLLEERLLRGEISEETYLNLKDKIEFEAKPFEPSPQLPPAIGTTSIEPEPTTPIPDAVETPKSVVEQPNETPLGSETSPIDGTSDATQTEVEPPMPPELPLDAYQQPPESLTQSQSEEPMKSQLQQAQEQSQSQSQSHQQSIEQPIITSQPQIGESQEKPKKKEVDTEEK